jgi:hypothetical protein
MRGLKVLLSAAAVCLSLSLVPTAKAQVSVGINLGVPPVCQWGYYDYAPYSCAPYGFYGSGYFYNGIFLGVGPWANWGYAHGWGGHRFAGAGGGHYVPGAHGGGHAVAHGHAAAHGHPGHPTAHGHPAGGDHR